VHAYVLMQMQPGPMCFALSVILSTYELSVAKRSPVEELIRFWLIVLSGASEAVNVNEWINNLVSA
jgi:hypothetical protein